MIGWGDSILGDGGKEKELRKQVQGAGRPKESEGRKGIGLHEYETGTLVLLRKASLSEEGIKE